MITVSIVSHGQGSLVASLLADLARLGRSDLRVVLTQNLPEADPSAPGLALEIIRNAERKGFGANHNHALRTSKDDFLCVMNPDVRLPEDPFPALLEALAQPRTGLAAPLVLSAAGTTENSARRFPTFMSLAAKGLGLAAPMDYGNDDERSRPDWVAGMFMLFTAEAFRAVQGFDERYFLYYEDVDLCRRLRLRGYEIRLVDGVRVVHDARKTSHRNLRYLAWHLDSIRRYLTTRYR